MAHECGGPRPRISETWAEVQGLWAKTLEPQNGFCPATVKLSTRRLPEKAQNSAPKFQALRCLFLNPHLTHNKAQSGSSVTEWAFNAPTGPSVSNILFPPFPTRISVYEHHTHFWPLRSNKLQIPSHYSTYLHFVQASFQLHVGAHGANSHQCRTKVSSFKTPSSRLAKS